MVEEDWKSRGVSKIINGDCIQILPHIVQVYGHPQLIFADPPYNFGVDYGKGKGADKLSKDEYLYWSYKWVIRCVETLAPNGSIWILVPDEWAAYFAVFLDKKMYMRSWIKWYETFGINCKNKFNRCSRHLLYYVKNKKDFIFNKDAVTRKSDRQLKYNDKRANPNGKIWDDVWMIPRLAGTHKERIREFPTQLPIALIRPIIGCATNTGDLVIDPFSGSGTTGRACREMGRNFVGIEKNNYFCELSRKTLC